MKNLVSISFALSFFIQNSVGLEVDPGFYESPAAQAAVGLTVAVSIFFGIYVVAYYYKFHKKPLTNEQFVTARHSANRWLIAFSFYASGVGSWVITGPADLAYWSGLIAAFSYGIATGLPVLLIAYFGDMIQQQYPGILSLSDFVNWRFGRSSQSMVVLVTLFNMGVAATSEYTTIASFFSSYVGLRDFDIFIVLLIAVVTLTYTAYGGLEVSIITDRIQAIVSIVLVLLVASYILATLRPLPPAEDLDYCISGENTSITPCSITFLDQLYGRTVGGYSSIFTLPASLICATVYSEAFWQRVWASENSKSLRFGAITAAIGLFLVVSTFGLIGVYGAWSSLTDASSDPNLRVFHVLQGEFGRTIVSSGWGVLVLLLAVIMSQSALDSMQNGIAASINGVTSRMVTRWYQERGLEVNDKKSLMLSRVIVILVNVPLVLVGIQKFEILRLFLITNMVSACGTIPLILGFVNNKFLYEFHNDLVPPISFAVSMLSLAFYGMYKSGGSFVDGIILSFWEQLYEYDYFLVALSSSLCSCLIVVAFNFLLFRAFGIKLPIKQFGGTQSGQAANKLDNKYDEI